MATKSVISVEYRGRVAVITIDNEKKLGALSQPQYYELATKMNEVAAHDEVYVTVLTGTGRFFSAGADVSISRDGPEAPSDAHKFWLQTFVAFNLNIAHTFATHPKVLVVGLNGPVVGLSAALVGWADFVYCTPHAFLLTPFSSLGLVAEGGASSALASRLGPARASEALLMSRRISAHELKQCGFVNEVFDFGEADDAGFRARVLDEVDERLGAHLNGESLLGIKKLLRRPGLDVHNSQNVHEVFAGLDRFVRGIPQEEFRKLASGEKRHKL
ncbi:3,2-trans-enoyl-CoA isomerase [Metarhizium album ARSEF 1941]|uniref:3,2-trans-enoyl-CoA isomerase n=1 Tax=Metarhizium album (strain ARSEF 1941) TaxID=1081103 RepID=A0A0B2X363_METAS|nr:3,2-trans-enoyl-CoA isomerase [Metarhizium album ARSEF 1941]KHO00749.1 3,2-trans-enoyl-CoA isomerase [Metarhizium album ARSEF 1941]